MSVFRRIPNNGCKHQVPSRFKLNLKSKTIHLTISVGKKKKDRCKDGLRPN